MKQYLVEPETKVKLSKIDPNDTGNFKAGKEKGLVELEKLNGKLETLQELLFAEHKHKGNGHLQPQPLRGCTGCTRA